MDSLTRKIEDFENEFDVYGTITRELTEYKANLSHQWDDNASRELNSKYLFTLSDNYDNISKKYSDQIQKIRLLNDTRINIENHIEEINNLSSEINISLNQSVHLRDSSGSFLELTYAKESDTNALLRKTDWYFSEIAKLKEKHINILKST